MNIFEKIEKHINNTNPLPKIIIIYWPTACWKTKLSLDIAEKLNTEIIWADSRQIYRLMDIWTGKIKETEKRGIQHYMIDIFDIDKIYSAWEYKKDAEKIIQNLHLKAKVPVICWGTWLYIDSIAFNFDIPESEPDWDYRNFLEQIRLEKWNEYIWNMLNEIDPYYANELEINNYRYIIRWLEVFKQIWKSKKEIRKRIDPKYDVLFITPYDNNRPKLYERINNRIEEMFDEWLIKEVKNILNKWYTKSDYWMNTIGYKEVIEYLEWEINLDKCKELVKQHNRNYAKRQLTWYRRYENLVL